MAYVCEVCQQIGNESFCFKRKEGLSRHQKSENCLRNNPYYDEVYNKRKNDQSNAQKNEKKRKLMYDKQYNDMLQYKDTKDKSLAYETITFKNCEFVSKSVNLKHMSTSDHQLINDEDELLNEDTMNEGQNEEISPLMKYQEKFLSCLYGIGTLESISIESFMESIKVVNDDYPVDTYNDMIALMNLSTECAMSNSRSRQLLQIVNGIYKRVHLKLIPRSLPGLKSEISKNLSHYKITNIQVDWYEHWKVHEIGIEDPIFIHVRNPIEIISEMLVDPEIMYKWKEHVHFEYYNDNNRIGNVMTSPWCANTQAELRQRSPQGTLLAIILYADGVALTENIHNLITPVICTLGNFSQELITKDISKGTISYIPNLRDLHEDKIVKHLRKIYPTLDSAKKAYRSFERHITRTVWDYIIKEINSWWQVGINMYVLGQGVKLFHPCVSFMVGDMPSQNDAAGIKNSAKVRYPCTFCLYDAWKAKKYSVRTDVQRTYRDSNILEKVKKAEIILNRVGDNMDGTMILPSDKEKKLLDRVNILCMVPMRNAFQDAPMGYKGDIFNATPPCLLHVFCGGLMKTLTKFIISIVEGICSPKYITNLTTNMTHGEYYNKHVLFNDRIDCFPYTTRMPHLNWTRFKGGILKHNCKPKQVLYATGSFGGFRSTSFISLLVQILYSLGDDIIPESGHYRLRNGREAKDPGKRIKVAVVLLLDVYFDSKRRQWSDDNISTFRANVTKLYDSFISVWNLLHEIYNEGKLRKNPVIKLHSIMHIADFIESKGSSNYSNTDHLERYHHYGTKTVYARTSKRYANLPFEMLNGIVLKEHNRRLALLSKISQDPIKVQNEYRNTEKTSVEYRVIRKFGTTSVSSIDWVNYSNLEVQARWEMICLHDCLNEPSKLLDVLKEKNFSQLVMEDLGIDLLAVDTNFKLYFAGGISSRDITLFACTKYSGTTFKSSKPRYDFVLIKEDWTAWNKGMVRVLAQILLFIVIEVNVKCDRRNCDNGNDQLKKQGFFCVVQTLQETSASKKEINLGRSYTWQRGNHNNFNLSVVNVSSIEEPAFVVPEYKRNRICTPYAPSFSDVYNMIPLNFFDREEWEQDDDLSVILESQCQSMSEEINYQTQETESDEDSRSDSTHSNISDDSSRSCMEYCDDISDVGYESDDVVH